MSTIFSDGFNRANSGTLGANWSTAKGMSGDLGIFSNQCASPDTFVNGSYYSATTLPNNQWAQVTCAGLSTKQTTIVLRTPTTGTAVEFYAAGSSPNDFGGANTTSRIYKYVAGASTPLATGPTALAAGQVWYFEVQGTNLVFKINGVTEISLSDSSLTSGQAGLVGLEVSANFAFFDDFSTGDFALGGPPSPSVPSRRMISWTVGA